MEGGVEIYCTKCGADIAEEMDDDEYRELERSVADDALPMWEGDRSSPRWRAFMRSLSSDGKEVYWRATWEAYSILNHNSINLLWDDDFKTNIDKHAAFNMMYNAMRHLTNPEGRSGLH